MSHYEADYLIPLELGGSPRNVNNLWAESHYGTYNSYAKDEFEHHLHNQMCDGNITLAQAQTENSTNWVQYWQLYLDNSATSTYTHTVVHHPSS